jgi:hypothetical protein
VELEARSRTCAEHLSERSIERAKLGRVRRCARRRVGRLGGLRPRRLPLCRQVLRRVPHGVREPDVLREQQQGAHELQ